MNSYVGLKHLHITCVAFSGGLFVLRFIWRLQASSLLQKKWAKIVPHIIDTCLLLSAVALAIIAGINPIEQTWLGAKIMALVIYIVLGTFAIKRAKSKTGQIISFALASLVFGYIILVAISKQALPFVQT
ncbi:SirB2 family protein [Undibacterium sp. Di24W]|uniref:SirB2 family protein n=1 Tax=Undibacterium sp. Di24W TaxID=3413033 RepID=UPI003BF04068